MMDSTPEFVRRNQIRIAGVLGVVGMAAGVVADLASGYSLDGTAEITTTFSVLSLENRSLFLVSKSPTQVVLGHYVAILGIPFGLFGFWQVYRAIQPAGWLVSRGVWFLGVFGFVAGTVFHSTFAFVTFGVQTAASVPTPREQALETMLAQFELVFEPLALLLLAVMGVAFLLIFAAIAFRRTHYPRWFLSRESASLAGGNRRRGARRTGRAPDIPDCHRVQPFDPGVLRRLDRPALESRGDPRVRGESTRSPTF